MGVRVGGEGWGGGGGEGRSVSHPTTAPPTPHPISTTFSITFARNVMLNVVLIGCGVGVWSAVRGVRGVRGCGGAGGAGGGGGKGMRGRGVRGEGCGVWVARLHKVGGLQSFEFWIGRFLGLDEVCELSSFQLQPPFLDVPAPPFSRPTFALSGHAPILDLRPCPTSMD